MTEAETSAELIDPALKAAGRDVVERRGIARETTGRNYGRIYAYDKYLEILNEGTEPLWS